MIASQGNVIRVGQGYTATRTIQVRDGRRRPVLTSFTGSEPLDLVICDLDGSALTLADSSASWQSAALGTITLTLDDSDTATMSPGNRGLSIRATINGEPIEVFRGVLRVEPRADETPA